MTTSISRNKMLARMERNDNNPYAAAKKGAHFKLQLSGDWEFSILSIDREKETLTYRVVNGLRAFIVEAARFNENFAEWRDNSQARYGKQCKYNWEIESVWEGAHKDHKWFLARAAAEAGDVATVMALVASFLEEQEKQQREEQEAEEKALAEGRCDGGYVDCEIC